MRKTKIETPLVFLMLFGFVTGGWFLTKSLLYQKRAELLGQRGQISLQMSDSTAFFADGQEEHVTGGEDSVFFQGEAVSEETMAKVLAVWGNGGREKLHEPEFGQMNMEQAIAAGKSWIVTLTEQGILPEEMKTGEYTTITASLCIVDTQVEFDEKLLSYWRLNFVKNEVNINLVIHALSGQVWKADILMWEEDGLIENYTGMEKWIKIAFPFIEEGDSVFVEEGSVGKLLSEGTVYASVKVSETQDTRGEWVKVLLHLEFELELKENRNKIYRYAIDH